MDILIGTKNLYKATEMVFFLGDSPRVNIHFLEDLGLEIKIEEEPEVVVEEETIEPKQEIESKPIYQRQDKRKK